MFVAKLNVRAQIWRDEIIQIITGKQSDYPDRSGGTPFSKFADRLKGVGNNRTALGAFLSLVNKPPHAQSDEEIVIYWRSLWILSGSLQYGKNKLALAFRSRLFGKYALPDNLKVFALNGFIENGGNLTIQELNSLGAVKKSHLVAWISAMIRSSHHKQAFIFLQDIFLNTTLTEPEIKGFLISLESWKRCFSDTDNFDQKIVNLWRVSRGDVRQRIDKWLTLRKINH